MEEGEEVTGVFLKCLSLKRFLWNKMRFEKEEKT